MRRRRQTPAAFAAILIASIPCAAATAADWDAGGGAAWQAILTKARQEGGSLVATTGCPALAEPLAAAFRRDTGLEVSFLSGPSANTDARYRVEVQSGRLTIDLRMAGAADIDLAKAGHLEDLNERLLLPDVVDPSRWSGGRLSFVDNTRAFMVVGASYVSSQPVINTDYVDPARLNDLRDLLRPEFKGKIAAFDPTVGGAGQGLAAYFAHVAGIDFVKTLWASQGVVQSRDSRQLAEWAARGLYPIILGADPIDVQNFRKQGVKSLQAVALRDAPGNLVGGCTVLSVPKGAPHPVTATAFVNWYLSQAGQSAYVAASQLPSLRADVSREGVLADVVPQPGQAYLDQYREDWYLGARPAVQAELRKAFDN
ncbi:MAG: extracellular solute-binding protein [Bauldia sp.]